jgi:hypothetical protein
MKRLRALHTTSLGKAGFPQRLSGWRIPSSCIANVVSLWLPSNSWVQVRSDELCLRSYEFLWFEISGEINATSLKFGCRYVPESGT